MSNFAQTATAKERCVDKSKRRQDAQEHPLGDLTCRGKFVKKNNG